MVHDPTGQTVSGVNRALRDDFGLITTTLRCLSTHWDAEASQAMNAYLVELRDPSQPLPAQCRWLAAPDLDLAELAHPEDRALLADWFAGRLGGFVGPPWFGRGWATGALAWIAAQVAQRGLTPTEPVEQVRSWERSSVWRVQTPSGALYFKAVPPVFAHEVALPSALNGWRPGCATAVLAHDAARGWMLMADLGERDLFGVRDLARWEAALRAYAELQIACIARRDALLALGCPQRPLADLPAGLDALLADEAAILPGEAEGLTAAQLARLRALAPALKAACAELAAFGLPETLDHGDLWGSNIFLAGESGTSSEGFCFHDWSDSALTHPFFGPLLTLLDADMSFPDLPEARARLRDAYLAPWAAFAPPECLRVAFDLAQRLASLDHALLYHRRILPAMQAKWEMAAMLPYFAGLLLA